VPPETEGVAVSVVEEPLHMISLLIDRVVSSTVIVVVAVAVQLFPISYKTV
jgi:hypothetical protein